LKPALKTVFGFHTSNASAGQKGGAVFLVGLGVSGSGSPFASFAFRNNTFGTFAFDDSQFFPVSGSGLQDFFNDMRGRLTVFSLVEWGAFSSSDAMSQNADQILGGIMAGDNAIQ
jgi:hypothetical protein